MRATLVCGEEKSIDVFDVLDQVLSRARVEFLVDLPKVRVKLRKLIGVECL